MVRLKVYKWYGKHSQMYMKEIIKP